MGSLWNFELSPEFVLTFPIFVETGYGDGHGVECAARFTFQRIYSIELYARAAQQGRERWASDPRISIVEGMSADCIPALLHKHKGEGIFFWLDAHFPGANYWDEPWDAYPLSTRLPLEVELFAIAESGAEFGTRSRYAILADDLNYYANLPYQQHRTPKPKWGTHRPLDFLTPFTATHNVSLILNDKGYALLVPLGSPSPRQVRNEE